MIGCVGVHGVDANARVPWDCLGPRGVRAYDLILLTFIYILINIGGIMTGGILPLYRVKV
jgi:hypothetical protein